MAIKKKFHFEKRFQIKIKRHKTKEKWEQTFSDIVIIINPKKIETQVLRIYAWNALNIVILRSDRKNLENIHDHVTELLLKTSINNIEKLILPKFYRSNLSYVIYIDRATVSEIEIFWT